MDINFNLLIFVAVWTFVTGQIEELFPLSEIDLQQIRELSPKQVSVAARSNVGPGFGSCRLVHECRRCSSQPQIVVDNIFDDDCDEFTHVRHCQRSKRVVSVDKSVKICHHKTEKFCETSCTSCPTFCQRNKQFWCEDVHEIVADIMEEDGKWKKLERISEKRRCFEKELEPLCATLNCRFDVISRECVDTVKPVNVTLTNEECEVCQPIATKEKIERRFVCQSTESHDCPDSGNGSNNNINVTESRWIKLCKRHDLSMMSLREPRTDDEALNEIIPLHDLFDMTAKPVRDLIFSKMKFRKEEVSRNLDTEADEQPSFPVNMKELKILNERVIESSGNETSTPGASIEVTSGKNSAKVTSSNSEYFDPNHNLNRKIDDNNNNNTVPVFRIDSDENREKLYELLASTLPPTKTTTTPPTTTTLPTPTTTTTTTSTKVTSVFPVFADDGDAETLTSSRTETSTTMNPSAKEVEYLTVEILNLATTIKTFDDADESVTLPPPTETPLIASSSPDTSISTTTTTSSSSASPPKPSNGLSAKEHARMCLFHGLCDFNQIKKVVIEDQTTTTSAPRTTPTTTTTAPRKSPLSKSGNFAVLAQIQRCIQTPEFCNTNLIPGNKNGTISTTPPPPTTTTTIKPTTTTLAPLDLARNCVVGGECESWATSERSSRLSTSGPSTPREQPRASTSSLALRVRLCLFDHICT